MPNSILSIRIASNEPDWVKGLDFDAPTAIDNIDAGDLQILTSDNRLLLVERKTSNDFLNSIADNRLQNQIVKMKAISPWCYVVITGSLPFDPQSRKMIVGKEISGWHVNAIQGFIRTLRELGAFVEQCASDGISSFPNARYLVIGGNEENAFAEHIKEIASRDRDEVKIKPLRDFQVLNDGERILSACRGIGWEKTQRLLEFCKTPAWALSYLTRLGESGVPGITDNTKLAIRQDLGLPDGWELWPILAEDNKE